MDMLVLGGVVFYLLYKSGFIDLEEVNDFYVNIIVLFVVV